MELEKHLPVYGKIRARLSEYYTPSETDRWLIKPHPQLDNKSAISAIERGDGGKVLEVLDRLDSDGYI